ncbi:apolipoprotein N-acyltransferase [Candidatus Planktophila versatilis]|uniref:Apolipoprotein N-acyltransferase n=1 Tax=Candidatus Planktophila versatilis TaxID=1884905 RepID=A0AAD0E6Z8_9ACTN|nr:apolipoprotein N-acyltransferase [Candidatus Planktophila versatilis]ASY22571.1 apolipoprotein N-acyltransferase [Candidatus Planktophila versatilis]
MVKIAFAAFLVSAAFEPIGIWYLAVIGLTLYLQKLRSSSRPMLHSLAFGFILNAIVLYWSGKYVGPIPWLLLSALQALFYLPVGWVYRRTHRLLWSALALLAMEEIRSRFPFGGFGWTRIAFSQVESPALPIVAIGGVIALSAFTLAIALLLVRIRGKNLAAILALFIIAFLLPANPQGSGEVNLIAIQGNTPEVGLGFNSRAKAVFDLHRDVTRRVTADQYDAIIWPENAIDIDPRLFPEVQADIAALTGDLSTPIIAGVVQQSTNGPQNASILFGEDGMRESVYIKRGLTPFGEYIPLRGLAELVSPLAKKVNDFIPGSKRVIHTVAGVELGPIICYEIILDDLVRDMAKNSKALIVQTNSATFAGTAESAQQLAITRIRAVEHSRAILSVSTVGMSAFIDNNGRVLSQTGENTQESLVGSLVLNNSRTLINRILS